MKIRNGFVSNSSSSSFCIYGIILEESELIEHFKKSVKDFDEECFDVDDIIDNRLIRVENDYNDRVWYLGRSYSTLKDDETGKVFRQKTEEILKPFFGDDIKLGYIEAELSN